MLALSPYSFVASFTASTLAPKSLGSPTPSLHLHRPQPRAPRSRIPLPLFFTRNQRMPGEDRRPAFPAQRLKLLLHLPVVRRHETDHDHPCAALEQFRT